MKAVKGVWRETRRAMQYRRIIKESFANLLIRQTIVCLITQCHHRLPLQEALPPPLQLVFERAFKLVVSMSYSHRMLFDLT